MILGKTAWPPAWYCFCTAVQSTESNKKHITMCLFIQPFIAKANTKWEGWQLVISKLTIKRCTWAKKTQCFPIHFCWEPLQYSCGGCRRLLHCVSIWTLRPVQLHRSCSLHHAAPRNHVSWHSDTSLNVGNCATKHQTMDPVSLITWDPPCCTALLDFHAAQEGFGESD